MGFWWFMLILAELCPLIMIIMGLVFRKSAPKKINFFFGYRTEMSMKNRETWEFAHKYIGNLWAIFGFALLVPTTVPMIFVIGESEELISAVALVLCFVGLAAFIASIIPTELALKKNFDKNGNRLNKES